MSLYMCLSLMSYGLYCQKKKKKMLQVGSLKKDVLAIYGGGV